MSYDEMDKEIQIKLDLIKDLWYNDIKLKNLDVTQKLHGCIIRCYVENGTKERLEMLENLLRFHANEGRNILYYYVYVHNVNNLERVEV